MSADRQVDSRQVGGLLLPYGRPQLPQLTSLSEELGSRRGGRVPTHACLWGWGCTPASGSLCPPEARPGQQGQLHLTRAGQGWGTQGTTPLQPRPRAPSQGPPGIPAGPRMPHGQGPGLQSQTCHLLPAPG